MVAVDVMMYTPTSAAAVIIIESSRVVELNEIQDGWEIPEPSFVKIKV
jgi:hypothetical protein